jgi:hypothetical protein
MSAIERLGNLGYCAVGKESTPGTPVTPGNFLQIYKSTLNTDLKLDEDNPIAGVRSMPYNQFMGMREHTGQITALAEPNTLEYLLDMIMAAGNITGGGDPYTHPFTEGLSNSYTMDILKGQIVERYWGVEAESLESSFNKNKMQVAMDISARGSFTVRKIATISTVTLTLDTSYDPAPNKGLVVGDLVRVMKADGSTTLDTVIATSGVNADGITIVLGASAAAYSAGDFIFLRAQTPSFSILPPFLWARTQFQFGSSASAALSATQLQLETGSKWKISHKFEKKQGSDRSGSFDPSSLVRLQTEAELTLKAFYDQPTRLEQYLEVASTNALVIRHFSGSNHELRLTFNQLRYKLDKRDIESAKIIYEELTGRPNYSTSDGQMMDVKVINALSA